jgi:hypothetical protein
MSEGSAERFDISIEDVIDREKIRAVLMRYVRGIDRRDADLLRTVYWPDAVDDHTLYSGDVEGFIKFFFDYYKDYVTAIHNIGSIIIDVEGPIAKVESLYTYFHRRPQDGEFVDMITSGRYIDRMEKRGTEWRIAARTVTIDWRTNEAKMGDWDKGLQFPKGGIYPDDPIYSWLKVAAG